MLVDNNSESVLDFASRPCKRDGHNKKPPPLGLAAIGVEPEDAPQEPVSVPETAEDAARLPPI